MPNDEEEVELPHLQELIDSATKDAEKATKELRILLSSHNKSIEECRRENAEIKEETRSFFEFNETAQIPSSELDEAKCGQSLSKHKLIDLNAAIQIAEPLAALKKKLESLDAISDLQRAVEECDECRQTLERLSPPVGRAAPSHLLFLRQEYSRIRRKWRLDIEARFAALSVESGSPELALMWNAASTMCLVPKLLSTLVTRLVSTLTERNSLSSAKEVLAMAEQIVTSEHYPSFLQKFWPALCRLANEDELDFLAGWEKELVGSGLCAPDRVLARRMEEKMHLHNAALRSEVLTSVRTSLLSEGKPVQSQGAWISKGCDEIVEQIRMVEQKDTHGVIIQDMLTLFSILRVSKLRQNTMEACLFFNDCQYLVRHCVKTVAPKLPFIRRLAEKHFFLFLQDVVNQFREHLPVDLFVNVERRYAMTEAALAQSRQSLAQTCDELQKWLVREQAEIIHRWIVGQFSDIIWASLNALQSRSRPTTQFLEALQQLLTPIVLEVERYGRIRELSACCSLLFAEWETLKRTSWSGWTRDRIQTLLFLNPKVLRPQGAINDLSTP